MARDQLKGWGEIAGYLGIDPRTAQRYEKSRLLPVHRYPGGGPKSPVFAIRSELDQWVGANATAIRSSAPQARSLAESILDRITRLSKLTVYRRNYLLRFALRRSPEGVRARLECQYEICNSTDERQSFVQELTVDDPDHGYVVQMACYVDRKPLYVLDRPSIAERCVGFSVYRGLNLFLEPHAVGVTYECRGSWIINRSENDFWSTHMALPTLGAAVETHAPSDFYITGSFARPDLLMMTGEHLDIAWKRNT